tara:strand:+ start:841 stop:1005 length:165 start_codon:yes stop_codon:yes gene_type:complete
MTKTDKLIIQGVNVKQMRMTKKSDGRIHNNTGYFTWLIKNHGKRINGQFAKLAK